MLYGPKFDYFIEQIRNLVLSWSQDDNDNYSFIVEYKQSLIWHEIFIQIVTIDVAVPP